MDVVYGPQQNQSMADVAQFWAHHNWDNDDINHTVHFRNRIHSFLSKLRNRWRNNTTITPKTQYPANHTDIKFKLGLTGDPGKTGRNKKGRVTAQTNYVIYVLGCKIVILSQRSRWEDH